MSSFLRESGEIRVQRLDPSFFAAGEDTEAGMSVSDAALSLISTIIGGGIVGLPFAFFHAGLPLGILLCFVTAYLTSKSCDLYLTVKEMTPGKLESLYELGFMIIGNQSIYFISFILTVSSFGLEMIYFIVFGDICKSLVGQIFFEETDESIFKTRGLYVVLLGASLFPMVIKKELKELKIASIILFGGIGTFLILLACQLIFQGNVQNDDESYDNYYVTDQDLTFVKGFSIIIVAFGCQQQLFPMVNSLQDPSRASAMAAVNWAIGLTNIIYISIAFLGVFFFGSAIEESILNNISLHCEDLESYVLRVIFLLVLSCHIPFIFFSGKESVLIIIDEFNRQSISKALMQKVGEMDESNPESETQLFLEPENQQQKVDNNDINEEEQEQEERPSTLGRAPMAYKEMPYHIYCIATTSLYVLEMIGAILVLDIGLIFEFISAIAIAPCASYYLESSS